MKEKSRAWRVPFTRWVLLRSPCEIAAGNYPAVLSVSNIDASEMYRVGAVASIQANADGTNLDIGVVARLQDILEQLRVVRMQRAFLPKQEN